MVQLQEEEKPWKVSARPQFMLDLRFADGDSLAFQYHDLVATRPTRDVLTLHFYYATVKIRGRHLSELHGLVREHKAYAVLEKHQSEFAQDERKPYIDRIEVDRPDMEALGRRPQG